MSSSPLPSATENDVDDEAGQVWDSPLQEPRHVRTFSSDLVIDDEETEFLPLVDEDEEDYDSASSSWSGTPQSAHSQTMAVSGGIAPILPSVEAEDLQALPPVEWETLSSWVKENGIFLQAALDLLQERDKHAPTVGMMDPVILKAGPIKKASILMKGIWKVKYVEIRRGMLSYYENLQNEDKLLRKDVPLRAHDCAVRAVKVHPSKAALQLTTNRRGGAIFELAVGGQKRLWMASSRDERQSWMQVIRNATVGGSLTTSNDHSDHRGRLRVVNPRSPFRHDLRLYLKAQSVLRGASVQAEYLQGLAQLKRDRPFLNIPVKWIAKEQELLQQQLQQQLQATATGSGGGDMSPTDGQQAFTEEEVDRSIEQLWRDLQRDSVAINGLVYRGDHGRGPEGIMGALAHQILQVSLTPSTTFPPTVVATPPPVSPLQTSEHTTTWTRRASESPDESGALDEEDTKQPKTPATPLAVAPPVEEVAPRWSDFSEAQALTYARDILLAGNRTRSGGDSYFCINTLLQNPDLAVVVPSSGEVDPVSFAVTSDEAAIRRNDKAGWIKCRSKLQRRWKKRFFVLSEGILSYYERALPRPNGLRGQLHMSDAQIHVTKRETKVKTDKLGDKSRPLYVISIATRDGKDRLLALDSQDRTLDWTYALECVAKVSSTKASSTATDASTRRSMRRRSTGSSSEAATKASTSAEEAAEKHAVALGMDVDKVRARLANLSRKASPSVRVSVEASTEYKVSTLDPEGDEEKDIWAVVRTSFHQSFRLTGGPGGRIMRGEEVVRVTFLRCLTEEPDREADDAPLTPRRSRKKSLFRSFSANDETMANPEANLSIET
jgi:hypothetical protein